MRINIDMGQPLCRGIKVNVGESSPQWVSFRYERMPIFWYWCGLLNHDEKDCKLWIRSKGTFRKEDQQYGVWLKASLERPQQRPNVALSTSNHQATTTTATIDSPIANLTEPQNSPSTSAINATRHTPTHAETLNAYDHLKSHINDTA